MGRSERGGEREKEGSGDSEQDAVELYSHGYQGRVLHRLPQRLAEEYSIVREGELTVRHSRTCVETLGDVPIACKLSSFCLGINCL